MGWSSRRPACPTCASACSAATRPPTPRWRWPRCGRWTAPASSPSTRAAVRRGLADVRWPGRLELLPGDPQILLDGAHNEAGVTALVTALEELRPLLAPGRPTLLFAVMADKAVERMLGRLVAAPALRDAQVVTTAVNGPRAMPAEALAATWRRLAGPGADVQADPVRPTKPSTRPRRWRVRPAGR